MAANFDVPPDETRLLVRRANNNDRPRGLIAAMGWLAELREKIGVKR